MAGQGSRFKEAGYDIYKPFLNIGNKKMIDGVLDPFESLDEIFIITTKKIEENNSENLSKLPSKVKILYIEDHKLGPAYSIYLAIDQLPKDREYFITYCDVWWSPKLNLELDQNIDAAIYVHRGFHPHLINDNFSAFCKETISGGVLVEIKEKGSFTKEWMKEPVSIGVFFIKHSQNLFAAIKELVEGEKRAAGEFYPSLLFNILLDKGLTVNLVDVEAYAHIGVPLQMKDVEFWSNLSSNELNKTTNQKLPWLNCMLMGGAGSRMKEISSLPKYMLPVNSDPMYIRVANKFNCKNTIIITPPDYNDSNNSNGYEIKKLKNFTKSHYETFLNSIEFVQDDVNILFSSCDCFASINSQKINQIQEATNAECIVFSFEPTLLHSKLMYSHTSIKIENGYVNDVDIKSKNKNYFNKLAGFFWFKNKQVVEKAIENINLSGYKGELLIDHLISELTKSGLQPAVYHLDDYIHLGTPSEYLEYKYWMERGASIFKI
jgi:NDP-sugar pyrophosphorylase family protein